MPRKPSIPKLCQHKASGKAVVRLSGRDHYLGAFGMPEAKAAYDRLIAEWLAAGRRSPQELAQAEIAKPVATISINEVLLAFWRHAERHYRHPDGRPTSEIKEYKYSLRPVRQLYGPAHGLLVLVRRRRVDQPVAGLDRIDDAPLALGEVGHLEDAEPQEWHLQTVVQRHHGGRPRHR